MVCNCYAVNEFFFLQIFPFVLFVSMPSVQYGERIGGQYILQLKSVDMVLLTSLFSGSFDIKLHMYLRRSDSIVFIR